MMLLRNLSTFLKQADSRIRAIRLTHPRAFWAAVIAIVPVAVVAAMPDLIWAGYSTNREAITPIATIIVAAVLASAALKQAATASRRHYAQTEGDQQRRIVETFTKTVEQLGSDKLEVRVGGIFALERLSKESPDDYWTIMEVLAAFVRDHMRYTTIKNRLDKRAFFLWLEAGRPEGRSEEFWLDAVRLERLEQTPTDIAAILTVIGRRIDENRQREEERGWRFDLRGTYLIGAFMPVVHLKRANLSGAHLERANLLDAHLEGAMLWGAHLEKAGLDGAHLEGANLFEAHLEGAKLWAAHLEGALLQLDAHLEGAYLSGAHLEGANLSGAHLAGANLSGAHLERANLQMATGLTDDQLHAAFGDADTKLPEGMTAPEHWSALEKQAG